MRKTIKNRALGATLGVLTIASLSLSGAMVSAQAASPAGAPARAAAVDSPPAKGLVSSKAAVTKAALRAGAAKFGAEATASESVQAYWTPKRMRNAVPMEKSKPLKKAVRKYEAREISKSALANAPAFKKRPTKSFAGVASRALATPEAAYNPNLPYYTPTAYTQGKVFFTKPGVGNFVCSGTIINSEGKDTVWTAGHCVHGGQGGSWHTNFAFVPAYDDDLANPRPYGTWTSNQLWSRTAWVGSSDFSQDIGVAIMNTNLGGWHIVDYFGGQGIRVNAGKNVYDYAFGYPAESPFDGGNLYRCSGTTSPEWDFWVAWSQTLKMSCDMTRGSSGGAWLNGYNGDWGYLNGVNSRIDRIVNPTIMLSPYFDNDAWSLFNATRYL